MAVIRFLRWLAAVARYVAIALALIALGILVHAQAFGKHDRHDLIELVPWAVLLLIPFVLIGVVFENRFRLKVAASSTDNVPQARVTPSEPTDRFDRSLNVLLAISPRTYLLRTAERITPRDGYYRHSLTFEWRLPRKGEEAVASGDPLRDSRGDDSEQVFFLPIRRLARGAVVDDLSVHSDDGRPLSTLNSREARGLVKCLLEEYTRHIVGRAAYEETYKSVIEDLGVKLKHDGPLQGTPAFARAELDGAAQERDDELLEQLRGAPRPSDSPLSAREWRKARRRLLYFLQAIQEAYIVFASVVARPGDRVVLRCDYSRPSSTNRGGARDWVRYVLGLRPFEHDLPLEDYRYTQSYHLRFAAPQEQYIFVCSAAQLPDIGDTSPSGDQAVIVAPKPWSGALDYANVYIRGGDGPPRSGHQTLHLRVECHETPPGLMGGVALISVAQAVLIWTLGIFHAHFFPSSTVIARQHPIVGLEADLPAVLLALPGLMLGWLGAQFTSERVRSTSLATIWGIATCGLLAVASTAIAIAKTAGDSFGTLLSFQHPSWVVLMLISGTLAVDLVLRSLLRTLRFARRMNRPIVFTRDPLLLSENG